MKEKKENIPFHWCVRWWNGSCECPHLCTQTQACSRMGTYVRQFILHCLWMVSTQAFGLCVVTLPMMDSESLKYLNLWKQGWGAPGLSSELCSASFLCCMVRPREPLNREANTRADDWQTEYNSEILRPSPVLVFGYFIRSLFPEDWKFNES